MPVFCLDRSVFRTLILILAAGIIGAATATPAGAAITLKPRDVTRLQMSVSGSDLNLSWDEVVADLSGKPVSIASYNIYRGTSPTFLPDQTGFTNRIGTSTTNSFTDVGGAAPGTTFYYIITAVDSGSIEGQPDRPYILRGPVPTVSWTGTTIDLQWMDAIPTDRNQKYLVYYGNGSRAYDFVDDVGSATSHSLTGLNTALDWYIAVASVDVYNTESWFSYEMKVNVDANTVDVQVMNDMSLCWGYGLCGWQDNAVRRRSNQESNVPIWFPTGNWVNVDLEWSVESRLCDNVPSKCGDTNPGWNPCGDPWDRTATIYLVNDDCVDTGAGCAYRNDNIELIHAITPFGTDADPPDGSGAVPPRVWNFDVTPLASELSGQKHIGSQISTFVRYWWVDATFSFSANPADASAEPPADGIVQAIYHSGGDVTTPRSVTIPSTATQVFMRYFVSGHGGNQACNGGSRDGLDCGGGCPGGSCQNCDEFCIRTNEIRVDGSVVFSTEPWRTDCSPGSPFACSNWNACGWPSCTFDRAGWCPGYLTCHSNPPCDQDLDATTWLAPGGTYDVTYTIPIRNGSWSKSILVYWYD